MTKIGTIVIAIGCNALVKKALVSELSHRPDTRGSASSDYLSGIVILYLTMLNLKMNKTLVMRTGMVLTSSLGETGRFLQAKISFAECMLIPQLLNLRKKMGYNYGFPSLRCVD